MHAKWSEILEVLLQWFSRTNIDRYLSHLPYVLEELAR